MLGLGEGAAHQGLHPGLLKAAALPASAQAVNLNPAVERALQPCNRMRSGLTQKVRFDKGEKVIRDKTFWEELSGQSRI